MFGAVAVLEDECAAAIVGLGPFEDVIGLAVVIVADREMFGAVAVLEDECVAAMVEVVET
jgi:hypothetical protein